MPNPKQSHPAPLRHFHTKKWVGHTDFPGEYFSVENCRWSFRPLRGYFVEVELRSLTIQPNETFWADETKITGMPKPHIVIRKDYPNV